MLLWSRRPAFGAVALCAGLLTLVCSLLLLVLWVPVAGDVGGFSAEGLGTFVVGAAVLTSVGSVAAHDWGKVRLGVPASTVDPPMPAVVRVARYLSKQDGSRVAE